MSPRVLVAAVLLAALAGHAACSEDAETPPPRLPKLGAFNEHVLSIVGTYPTDGTHGYHWPRRGSWLGFTRDMRYQGELLGGGDEKGRCHCSGLTLEVFLRAWARWSRATGGDGRILDLDLDDVRAFQRAWFGTSGDRATPHTALTEAGLGVRIADWEKARPGDFVQLWRHSGSGHSCIFQGWVRESGKIVGLRYWSTQSSTKGIGSRVERFGDAGSKLKRDELYVVRVGEA